MRPHFRGVDVNFDNIPRCDAPTSDCILAAISPVTAIHGSGIPSSKNFMIELALYEP